MHVNCLNALLAFAAPASGSQSGQGPAQNPFMAFLPMILLVVVFYFVLLRPQQQRAKKQAQLLSGLKSGDKVVTASGILGTVISVKDNSVTLLSGGAKFEVTKASVTDIVPDASSTPSVS